MELETKIKLSDQDIHSVWYWAEEYRIGAESLKLDPLNNFCKGKAIIELNRLVNNAFREGMEFQKKVGNV